MISGGPVPVSIVIPVFNRVDMTEQCLRHLADTVDQDAVELVVVDNGSSDGSAELVRDRWPSALVVRNATNAGFARGCNQGVAASHGELVVLLNNDTEPSPGWLEALLAPLADPTVAIVAPKLLFPDGTVQHAGMVLMEDRQNDLALNPLHVHYRKDADLPAVNRSRDVQLVTGAVLAMRRAVFDELGGFDEGYWNGCEDVDLCLTAGAAGYRVRYEPAAVLVHHESASGAERWTKVNDNLRRLCRRWAGRVQPELVRLANGSVLPTAGWPSPPTKPGPIGSGAIGSGASAIGSDAGRLSVALEGSLFQYHSLAQVNRELAVRLAAEHGIDVQARYPALPEVTVLDDARLAPVLRASLAQPPRPVQVTIRHQWPPKLDAPADDLPVVVCQPWEFGGLPDDWVTAFADWPDEIWCYTSWVRDCYRRSGVPADRLVTIPLGVDTNRFRPEGPRYPLATERSQRFLFVGGLIQRKGIDVLLEAYGRGFDADDDVCLVIKSFGAASFYRDSSALELVEQLRSRPGAPEVELITDDLDADAVAALYRSCQTLVHPYRGEGFGLPIAEAMASGLLVVVTDDGAARDFTDADTALLIPSTRVAIAPAQLRLPSSRAGYWFAEPDVDALAGLLRAVVEDPQRAATLAAAGRDRVQRELNWDDIAARVAGRLQALASHPARRSSAAPVTSIESTGPGVELHTDLGHRGDGARPAPYTLDDPRRRTLLAVIGRSHQRWPHAVTAAARTLGELDDATLVVAVHDPQRTAAGRDGAEGDAAPDEALLEQLGELLEDGEGADVLAIAGVDDVALISLLVRCDAVLTDDEELVRAARRWGALAVDPTEAAISAWLSRVGARRRAA